MASLDAIVKLEQLQYYDSKLKAYVDARFELVKADTPTTGAFATYILQTSDASHKQLGKVDIPKDKFVQSASLWICETDDTPEEGMKEGEQYIKLVVDTADSEDEGTALYINVSKFQLDLEFATNDDIDAMFDTTSDDDDDDDETDTITIVVKKEWSNGSNEGSQPTEVTVKLNKTGGDDNPIKTETLNDDNSWTVTWDELEGTIEDYTVEEDTVEDYTATGLDSPEDDTEGTYTYTIINTYDE